MRHAYMRFNARFVPVLRLGGDILAVMAFAASLVCITGLVVYFGFDHNPGDLKKLGRLLRGCQIVFIVNVLYGLTLLLRQTLRQTKTIKWIVDLGVLLTLLPLAYPRPDHPWIAILDSILYSNRFLFTILGAYSVVDISFGIIKVLKVLLGRKESIVTRAQNT